MKDLELVLVLACVLVLVSILASKASGRSGVPALLLFLGIGMLAGSEGIGGIYFDNADLARSVGVVALALILFSGGLDTRWAAIRPVLGRGVLLATVGTLVTAGLVGGLVLLVTDLPLLEALLLGAVVSSTDAAAVFSVLRARQVRLPGARARHPRARVGQQRPHGGLPHREPHRAHHRGRRLSAGARRRRSSCRWASGPLLGLRARARAWPGSINRIDLEHDGLYPVLSLTLVLLTYGADGLRGRQRLPRRLRRRHRHGRPRLHPQAQPDALPRRPRLARADRHVPDARPARLPQPHPAGAGRRRRSSPRS